MDIELVEKMNLAQKEQGLSDKFNAIMHNMDLLSASHFMIDSLPDVINRVEIQAVVWSAWQMLKEHGDETYAALQIIRQELYPDNS